MRILIAIFLTMLLTGCASSGRSVSELPEMPGYLARDCALPKVRRDARKALIDHRLALVECRDRHRGTVAWYSRLRK